MTPQIDVEVEARARESLGVSEDAIYATVADLLASRAAGGVLADIGCGSGNLWPRAGSMFDACLGIDVVRYEGLPPAIRFRRADLDRGPLPLDDHEADVAAAVETIEHLENPRAFFRELVRVTRPGGWVVVTTPNQLSALSLATLVARQRFSAFQDGAYPAHRTALLEIDLRRIARECRLRDVEVRYTYRGRVPLSAAHYPKSLARRFPRLLSDNLAIIGRTPAGRE